MNALTALNASIPSPSQGVWHLGPIPVRAYAFCILAGIAVAILISRRRWRERGGDPVVVIDIATWAVPFGVVGGRIYHVITSPQAYFGSNGEPIKALYVWEGGLGIWGAVVLGGVGAWIGCRRHDVKLTPFGDAIAPGIAVAQAVGRFGNWFNNELYGQATSKPWGLEIHQWDSAAGQAQVNAAGKPEILGIFQPTFLYESVWDLLTAAVLILADRRWKLGHGRVFALYVMVYSLGRGWIETLRIDDANHILGLRLNVWTSVIVFVGGLLYLILSARLRPGRETDLTRSKTEKGEPDPGTPDETPEGITSSTETTASPTEETAPEKAALAESASPAKETARSTEETPSSPKEAASPTEATASPADDSAGRATVAVRESETPGTA